MCCERERVCVYSSLQVCICVVKGKLTFGSRFSPLPCDPGVKLSSWDCKGRTSTYSFSFPYLFSVSLFCWFILYTSWIETFPLDYICVLVYWEATWGYKHSYVYKCQVSLTSNFTLLSLHFAQYNMGVGHFSQSVNRATNVIWSSHIPKHDPTILLIGKCHG